MIRLKPMMKAKIERALNEPKWEDFNYQLEKCHDSGFCGETIANANIATYDPMFCFFHCNWDRLWWRWQHAVGATRPSSVRRILGLVTLGAAALLSPLASVTVVAAVEKYFRTTLCVRESRRSFKMLQTLLLLPTD